MIAVIADDLTGAAEISGIAVRHGLRVVMDTKIHSNVDTDVLVIATDSRSRTHEEARALTIQATDNLIALKPELIFKKTDSLLRGHVGEELTVQMALTGQKRTLLIPANPLLKRTIKDGIYYANNIPLNESPLADASRNKIATSAVLELMGDKFKKCSHVISIGDVLPEAGLLIGNTLTETDLDLWADCLDENTIPAGSSGFFNAIVKRKLVNGTKPIKEKLQIGDHIIYVCGSAFPKSKAEVNEARITGRFVSYLPENMFCKEQEMPALIAKWRGEIIKGIRQHKQVIIAVSELQCNDPSGDIASRIKHLIASMVEQVMQEVPIHELVIEGGATASAIIDKLDYERFIPIQELAPGVIRMKVEGNDHLHLTMKPGSYQWPSSIWQHQEYII